MALIICLPLLIAIAGIAAAWYAFRNQKQDDFPTQPFEAPVESASAASSGGGGGPKEPA